MLTHNLEKLILAGKASYNTFVAGGSQKHVLTVDNDRFIIITDLIYFNSANAKRNWEATRQEVVDMLKNLNTQVRIFSSKSINQFLFRNSVNIIPAPTQTGTVYNLMPFGSVKIDTYLVHESNVSITFSYAGDRINIDTGNSETDSIAFAPPYDYGKDGQPGVLPVRLVSGATGAYKTANAGLGKVDAGDQIDLELSFPVDAAHNYAGLDYAASYPILQIGYVEILGNPTNLSSSI